MLISQLAISQKSEFIIQGNQTIHLITYGKGAPLLVINGGPGMNCEGFKPLAKILGKSNKVIVYDQRGTGKSNLSDINTETITLDAMIDDIEAIRNHLNIENWVVFGHSFGGMLGSYYASLYPNRVKGLILSSSGGIDLQIFEKLNITSSLTISQRDSLDYWNSQIANGDTTYHARLQRGKFLAPAYVFDKSNVTAIAQRLTQGNLNINQLVWQNMRKMNFNCVEELKSFESPVLIIQGEQDVVDKSISEVAHKVFQNSKLVFLERCVHYGWLDRPDEYFKTIEAFMKEVEMSIMEN